MSDPAAVGTSSPSTTGAAVTRRTGRVALPSRPGSAERAPQPPFEDVPKLLNQWQVVAVVVCVLFGVLAGLVQLLGYQSTERAAANTEQQMRIQGIQSSLFRADALATNAYLAGGLESRAQRDAYDTQVERALADLTAAADAQPADRAALSELNVQINEYTTAVAQARSANRQGYPVGAQYMRDASDALRADTVPILDALLKANSDRAEDELGSLSALWLLLIGIATLAVLFWLNHKLAARFRRRINKGLAAAGVLVLVATVLGVIYAYTKERDLADLKGDEYARAVDESTARAAGNDAKAAEARRLIDRSSGQEADDAWKRPALVVEMHTEAYDEWEAYAKEHARLVKDADNGRWEEARDEAVNGTVNAAFDAFDTASAELVQDATDTTVEQLRNNAFGLVSTAFAALAGLVAALACVWGFNQRRKEYS